MNKRSIIIFSILLAILVTAGIMYRIIIREPEPDRYDNLTVFLPGIEISALYDDGERLWAGTAEGIYLLDRDTGEICDKAEPEVHMIYSAQIVETEDGLIWAGHEDGLSAFDKTYREVIRFTTPDIPGGRVNSLWADDNGLWVGSQEGAAHISFSDGLWKVDETLTKESGLSEDVVQVIEKIGDELWFGSYLGVNNGGISIRSADGWDYLSTIDGIPHRYINAILPLSEKRVLIGSGQLVYGGLSLAEKQDDIWKITKNWDAEDGIPGMKVRQIFLDSSGKLWITTEADGLILLDSPDALKDTPLNGQVIKQENGLSDNEIKCIAECDSCLWLGGRYGLTRYGKQ